MIGFPVYLTAKHIFKVVSLNRDSVLKGGFTMLNFKIGLTIRHKVTERGYNRTTLHRLEEVPETENDRIVAKATYLSTQNPYAGK